MSNSVYVLRKLKADDLFPAVQILKKIGFDKIKECFKDDSVKTAILQVGAGTKTNDNAVASIGMEIAMNIATVVISNLNDVRRDLYKFLSGLSGLSEKQICDLDLDVFASMIVDVITKDEFKDFFKVAAKLFK